MKTNSKYFIMKRFILFFFLGILSFTSIIAQDVYDSVKAEIIANKLTAGKIISRQEAQNAVNYALIGISKIQSEGDRLLDLYPEGSDWVKFHKYFESVEKEYNASFVIIENVENFKKLLPDKDYAKLTIALRDHREWYSRFCQKQKRLSGCPYD